MVVMSAPKAQRRNGIRASSRMVTMVAWLTCWYMSMSDQRTGTGATKSGPGCVTRSVPVPLVLRHAADLSRRHRQRRQV